jgi:hypothetical protein
MYNKRDPENDFRVSFVPRSQVLYSDKRRLETYLSSSNLNAYITRAEI